MRTLLFLLPLLAAATLAPQSAPMQTPSNLKARNVVNQAIATLGGDLYLQARDHSGDGRMYTFGSSGSLDNTGTPFWAFFRFPGQERIELEKKRDVIEIYSGNKGWEITYKGIAPLPAAQVQQYVDADQHSLDTILKTWVADPRTLLLYEGLNSVDQEQVETVAFTTAHGDAATVDFALDTHLPVRTAWRRNDPDTGGHFEQSVAYGKWSQIDGIFAPYSQDYYQGTHKTGSRFYNEITYAPVPDSMFQPAPLKKK